MPASRAGELLMDAQYAVRVVEQPDQRYPPGTVLAQDPPARAPITKGTAVALTVARSPHRTQVPSVLGLLADEAGYTLAEHGLQAQIVREAEPPPGSPARAGRAWKQSRAGGSPADEGDTIIVYVNP
jgi:beta-lactam-binding protein with PASTA domain